MTQDRPTIWCLHGAVGAAADWNWFRESWEQAGYDFRAVDLWRFLDCCPRSLSDTAMALNAEVSANPGKNLLVAYSMGGRIALHALLADNSPWHRAIIVAAHPGLENEEEKIARRQQDAEWSVCCHRENWSEFLDRWQAQPILKMTSDLAHTCLDRGPLHLRCKEISRSFISWSLGAQENLWPLLKKIRVPVLWLTGEWDAKFGSLAERACRMIPHACAMVVTEAGHRLPWQQSEAFSREVLAFFAAPDQASIPLSPKENGHTDQKKTRAERLDAGENQVSEK